MWVMGALYENVHDKRQSVMSDNSIFDTKVFHAPLLQFSTKIIVYYNVLPDKGYKFFFTHASYGTITVPVGVVYLKQLR